MSDVTFRPFEISDQTGVWNLHAATLIGTFAVFEEDGWDSDLDEIESAYDQNNGSFLVGDRDGTVVAMGAVGRIDDSTAMIKRLRVAPADQRKGIGTNLLHALVQKAIDLGYRELRIDVTRQQTVAQKILTKAGFHEAGAHMVGAYVIVSFSKDLS